MPPCEAQYLHTRLHIGIPKLHCQALLVSQWPDPCCCCRCSCRRRRRRANPYGEHYLDGVSLNPFEVLFVKVRRGCGVWERCGAVVWKAQRCSSAG